MAHRGVGLNVRRLTRAVTGWFPLPGLSNSWRLREPAARNHGASGVRRASPVTIIAWEVERKRSFDHAAWRCQPTTACPAAKVAVLEELRAAKAARDDARHAGRPDEARRLEVEVQRVEERSHKIFRPEQEAVSAQHDLSGRHRVDHHTIKRELKNARSELADARATGRPDRVRWKWAERQYRELWERA